MSGNFQGNIPRHSARMEALILTLTVNPAIDRTITVDRLAFEDRAYITSTHDSAGGRGIHASSVIHSFGGETMAIAPAGGKSGARFEEYLRNCGFPYEIVPIRKPLRTNLAITDKQGLTAKLNETGPPIEKAELARIEKAVTGKLDAASWLMICGSLPPGVPSHFYAQLVKAARHRGVKTLLDADGEALRHGIEEGPTVVTPNQSEAERLLNRTLLTRAQFLEAAATIQGMGAESVILSLGSRGAVGASGGVLEEFLPPRVDAVCPIGAGDAMAAVFVWAMERKHTFSDAVRWGVAAGTASARLHGLRFASLAQTEEIYQHVEVRRVE